MALARFYLKILTLRLKTEEYFDLNLSYTNSNLETFILYKSQYLLFFNTHVNGLPIFTPIFNKSAIAVFYNNLLKTDTKQISYNRDKIINRLDLDSQVIKKITDTEIIAVCNFISIGYLIKKNELDQVSSNPTLNDFISRLFKNILVKKPPFLVSNTAMDHFSKHGKAIVPLVGIIPYSPKERLDYMNRFNNYLLEDNYEQFKIINSKISNITILFTKNLCIIYTLNNKFQNEKFHIIALANLYDQLIDDIKTRNLLITNFTTELWESFQEELMHIISHTKDIDKE